MKRLLILAGFAAGAAAFVLVSGCSTTSTGPGLKMAGDTNSAEFQAASAVFDTAQAYGDEAFGGSFDLAGGIFASKSPSSNWSGSPSVVVAAEYHPESKFWVRNRSGVEYKHVPGHGDSIADSLAWTIADSVQFRTLDSAVMVPDSASLAEVRSGCAFRVRAYNSPDSLLSGHVFDVVGAPGSIWGKGDVAINASGSTFADLTGLKHRHDTVTVCDVAVSLSSDWHDLRANLAQILESGGCPSSGTITHMGTLNVACSQGMDSLKFTGSWSRTKTFDDGMISIVFESPSTQWTVTRTCGGESAGLVSSFVEAKNSEISRK